MKPAIKVSVLFTCLWIAIGGLVCTNGTDEGQIVSIQSNFPPNLPKYPEPLNNEIGTDTALVLSWAGKDPDSLDTVTYSVYLDTINPPQQLIKIIETDTLLAVDGLKMQTRYYWRVDASDGTDSRNGLVWSFQTRFAGWSIYRKGSSGLPGNEIADLAFDNSGTLWLGLALDGLAYFHAASGQFLYENSPLLKREISAIGVSGQSIYAGFWSGGLAIRSGSVWTEVNGTYAHDSITLATRLISAIDFGLNENLWIGTTQGLLARVRDAKWLRVKGPALKPVLSIRKDSIDAVQSRMLIGTTDGLVTFNAHEIDTMIFIAETTTIAYQTTDSLGKNKPVVTDRRIDTITLDTTLFYIDSSSARSDTVWKVIAIKDTVSGNTTNKTVIDTARSVKYRALSRAWLTAQFVVLDSSALPDKNITALAVDNKKDIWVGTSSAGICRISQGTVANLYSVLNSPLPNNSIKALAFDSTGNLWIGTRGGGLAKLAASGVWTVYTSANSGLPSDHVFAIQPDSNNRLWIGTSNGLAVFDNR